MSVLRCHITLRDCVRGDSIRFLARQGDIPGGLRRPGAFLLLAQGYTLQGWGKALYA